MPNLNFVPEYLKPFVAVQNASLYTPMDHAAWRFILKISKQFFKQNAHEKYLNGLSETGISSERIPLVSEMDECLKKFGWRAVPVNGFIPPSVFMEFQSLGILPIACEMRTMDHLSYTPAPDIVHEAAGHAPIIADEEYAAYLSHYGTVSRKAIYSSEDMNLFEAIRNLSVVKEDPKSTLTDIEKAEERLQEASSSISFVSEAAYLARMNWWTVEYGLVGELDQPKIYGAGLLSSVGESFHCLGENVKKIPLTLECLKTSYDITKPQPQLFVTKNFSHLTEILNEYAETMAYKKGGIYGVNLALEAKTVTTIELDSGIQISGVLEYFMEGAYLKMKGPTQLSFKDSELSLQGPEFHKDGFSTLLGEVKGFNKCLSDFTDEDIKMIKGELFFKSGFHLKGELISTENPPERKNGKLILLSFKNCKVTRRLEDGSETLFFDPSWGRYDLACGTDVVSVFGGAADRKNYLTKTGGLKKLNSTPKCNLTAENSALNKQYLKLRSLRESLTESATESLKEFVSEEKNPEQILKSCLNIHSFLNSDSSESKMDWLLRLEILEILKMGPVTNESTWKKLQENLVNELEIISLTRSDRKEMIKRGLECL